MTGPVADRGLPLVDAVVATTTSVLARWRRAPGLIREAVTEIELGRAAAFRRSADIDDFLAAHLLARDVGAGVLQVPAHTVQLAAACPECGSDRHGAPSIVGRPRVSLSLSHASGVVAAAAGPGPLGIDVEASARRLDVTGLADTVLAPAERMLLAAAADPERAFLSLWVRKEALVKAGAADLGSLTTVDLSDAGEGARWRSWTLSGWAGDLPRVPGVVAALAARGAARWTIRADGGSAIAAAELPGDRAP